MIIFNKKDKDKKILKIKNNEEEINGWSKNKTKIY